MPNRANMSRDLADIHRNPSPFLLQIVACQYAILNYNTHLSCNICIDFHQIDLINIIKLKSKLLITIPVLEEMGEFICKAGEL